MSGKTRKAPENILIAGFGRNFLELKNKANERKYAKE